ncbi:hypothetical protein DH2020_047169 [Rehmannia glutinosa]|uniref:Uncharacterized protein n=1 Tax=Rehmannia glutinosa TaxID=99300 RepID=A0ABR0U985_REHGL
MISMRKEDFEKLVMERSQQLAKERERERGIPDPDPMTGPARDHDAHKRMGKKGGPGDLEQEDEAESRTPPPRPRSFERVGLGVEGLGVPVTRVPLGDNLQELSEQIELATKKLEEMKRRGAVTSALQKRGSPFCEEILVEDSQQVPSNSRSQDLASRQKGSQDLKALCLKLKGIPRNPLAHKRDFKTSRAVKGVPQEVPRAPRKILRSQGTLRPQGLVPKIEIKWKGIPKDPRAHKRDLKTSQAVEGVSQEVPRAPRKILRSQGTLRSQGLVPKIEIKWKGIP